MPPKKKKILGITVFQRKFRADNPNYGNKAMGDMSLIRACQEEWDRLPKKQQEQYEIIASKETKKLEMEEGHTWKRDCHGESIADNQLKEQTYNDYLEKQNNFAIEYVSNLKARGLLLTEDFIIADVNSFLFTKTRADGSLHYLPAEISLIRVNFTKGIIPSNCYSVLPSMEKLGVVETRVPMGYRAECLESVEDSHGIPLTDNEEAVKNYGDICRNILSLCKTRNNDYLPIFAPHYRVDEVQLALIDVWEQGKTYTTGLPVNPWLQRGKDDIGTVHSRVYQLDYLIMALSTKKMIKQEIEQAYWKSTQFDSLSAENACSLHNQYNMELKCSLYNCKRYFWQMCNKLHPDLNFTDHLDELLPSLPTEKAYTVEKVNWMSAPRSYGYRSNPDMSRNSSQKGSYPSSTNNGPAYRQNLVRNATYAGGNGSIASGYGGIGGGGGGSSSYAASSVCSTSSNLTRDVRSEDPEFAAKYMQSVSISGGVGRGRGRGILSEPSPPTFSLGPSSVTSGVSSYGQNDWRYQAPAPGDLPDPRKLLTDDDADTMSMVSTTVSSMGRGRGRGIGRALLPSATNSVASGPADMTDFDEKKGRGRGASKSAAKGRKMPSFD